MWIAAVLGLSYAVFVIAWRWLLRRWRLAGPGAPRRDALGRQEYLARRSLRALLAFDFLVIFPTGALMAVMGVASGAGSGSLPLEMLLAGLGGMAMFAFAIPGLRRRVATLEQRRLAGLPDETDAQALARARSTGHDGLDAHLLRRAWGTLAVSVVIGAVSVAAWLAPDDLLLVRLAKVNEAVRGGEVWRLVTVALVHAGIVHLFFNLSVLSDVGGTFERLAGTRRMLLVLLVGTVAGSVASVLFVPSPSVGASGGVLALAAALLLLGYRHRSELPATARTRLLRAGVELVALNLVLTFALSGVDWAAHLGGMAAGALLGWVSPLSAETRRALAAPPSFPDAHPGAEPLAQGKSGLS